MQEADDKDAVVANVDRLEKDIAEPIGVRKLYQKHLHIQYLPG